MKCIKTEADVGKCRVDILAGEESSDRKIIIENQLEKTNHDHQGKIITYASRYDAEIIIWIVRDVREEHQKAIEWLNEHTDESNNFFLIKLELWQIDGSNPAPKFEIVVRPKGWVKEIKSSSNTSELSETRFQQLNFWTKFKNYIQEKDTKIKLQKPSPQGWYPVSMGTAEGAVLLTLNSLKNRIACQMSIRKNKVLFNFLKERKDEIEKEIGDPLEWKDEPIVSRIKISKEVSDVFDQNGIENYFKWLYEKTILFQKVFGPNIKEYKKSQRSNPEEA